MDPSPDSPDAPWDLLRQGRYSSALDAATSALRSDTLEVDSECSLRICVGRLYYEFGQFAKASAEFRRGATLTGSRHARWAQAFELESDLRVVGEDSASMTARIVSAIGRLRDEPLPAEEREPLFWLAARQFKYLDPDSTLTASDLREAHRYVAKGLAELPDSPSLLLEDLRLRRVIALSDPARKVETITEAIARADQLIRSPSIARDEFAVTSSPLTPFLYEQCRFHIVLRQWREALEGLDRILADHDPLHQSSVTWSIYCRRILEIDPGSLETIITRALGDHPSGDPHRIVDLSLSSGPLVVAPHLRAELLTERAALLEDRDQYEEAARDYRRALVLRQKMDFAHRGLLRCLLFLDRTRELDEAVATARRDGLTSPHFSVELGQLAIRAGRVEEGLAHLDEAIRLDPSYAYAYQAKIAGLRKERRYLTAEQVGGDFIALHAGVAGDDQVVGVNGVRVERAAALVKLQDYAGAQADLALACADQNAEVRDRSISGLIHAHLLDRGFTRAKEIVDEELSPGAEPGVNTLEAAGTFFQQVGDYTRALQCWDRALSLRPRFVAPLLNKAQLLQWLGRPCASRDLLVNEAARQPSFEQYRFDVELGWCALELADLSVAKARFTSALHSFPSAELAHRGLIRTAARLGLPGEVEVASAQALKEVGSTEDSVARNTALADIHYEVGCSHFVRGEFQQAYASFQEMRRFRYTFPRALLLAHFFLDNGSTSDAQRTLAEFLGPDSFPRRRGDPDLLLAQARLDLAKHEVTNAYNRYTEILTSWPGSQTARYGQAMSLLNLDEPSKAIEILEPVVEGCPEYLAAEELLTWALVRHGETAPSNRRTASFESVATHCSNILATEATRPIAYMALAHHSEFVGEPHSAQRYLSYACTLPGIGGDCWRELASFYLRTNEYELGVEALKNAELVGPLHARTRALWGLTELARGNQLAALVRLEGARLLDPRDLEMYLLGADALDRTGEYARALQTLDEADKLLQANLGSLRSSSISVPKEKWTEFHLLKARVLYHLAHDSGDGDPRYDGWLDEALVAVGRADSSIATYSSDTSSDEAVYRAAYLRGVVLTRQKKWRQAEQAFKAAIRSDPNNVEARRAFEVVRGKWHAKDLQTELVTVTGAWTIVVIAVLIVLAMAATLLFVDETQGHPHFGWHQIEYAVAALLIAIGLGSILPRLTHLRWNQVELAVSPIEPPTPAPPVDLQVGALPVNVVSGSLAYRPRDAPFDRQGEPVT